MSDIQESLTLAAGAAFAALGADPALGAFTPCADASRGDFQCVGAMPAAKAARRPPREIADSVAAALAGHPDVRSVEVAGPGFVNVRASGAALLRAAAAGHAPAPRGRAVVDHGGPNIAKAMHVGHLRSSIIGESVKRVLRELGWEVRGDVHLGDWGLPMGLLAAQLEYERPGLPWTSSDGDLPAAPPVSIEDLERMYPLAAARAKEDAGFLDRARALTAAIQAGEPGPRALWGHFRAVSVERLADDFASIGVTFDDWFGESTCADTIDGLVASLEAAGIARASDGALVVDVARPDDAREVPPLLLRKSDGAALYSTTDLATVAMRARDLAPDLVVYLTDARQALHFEQVFRTAALAGLDGNARLVHAVFGTVNGTDGKPFKTREGGVMRLSDLVASATSKARERLVEGGMAEGLSEGDLEETARVVGIGAVKFADFSASRTTSYVFDLDRFVRFEGRTGPYVQYGVVRLRSVAAKAATAGLAPGALGEPTNDAEAALMLSLSLYGDALESAARELDPSELARWAFSAAQAASRFYNASPVLREADAAVAGHRLALAALAAARLERALHLLGIEVPGRM